MPPKRKKKPAAPLDVIPAPKVSGVVMKIPFKPNKDSEPEDYQDGYLFTFNVQAAIKKPYTIIQTITRSISWDPLGPDDEPGESPIKAVFTEGWVVKAGPKKSIIRDRFSIPRYYRTGANGSFKVKAQTWVVPGNKLDEYGLKKGQDAKHPWGAAHGGLITLNPPPNTEVLKRSFECKWKNKGKTQMKNVDFKSGKDMDVTTSIPDTLKHTAKPPEATKPKPKQKTPPASPEIHTTATKRKRKTPSRDSSPELYMGTPL